MSWALACLEHWLWCSLISRQMIWWLPKGLDHNFILVSGKWIGLIKGQIHYIYRPTCSFHWHRQSSPLHGHTCRAWSSVWYRPKLLCLGTNPSTYHQLHLDQTQRHDLIWRLELIKKNYWWAVRRTCRNSANLYKHSWPYFEGHSHHTRGLPCQPTLLWTFAVQRSNVSTVLTFSLLAVWHVQNSI